jgi:integrase
MGAIAGAAAGLHRLTSRQVLAAESGDLNDGGGLILRVGDRGSSWVFRYTSPVGRRREMGLGVAWRDSLAQAGQSLASARDAAQRARMGLQQGIDPLQARDDDREAAREAERVRQAEQARQAWRLCHAARDYHRRVIAPTRTDKHAAQWISSLENHIPPALWQAPLHTITAPALLASLMSVSPHERARRHKAATIPETVRRIRQRLDAIFEDAIFHGHAASNPAAAITRKMREATPRRAVQGRFAALPYREAPALLQRLQAQPGTAARCLEFAVLAAARTGEVLGARWGEFDFDARTWTVPASRMKAKAEHVVHLPPRALAIVLAQRGQDGNWVFPTTSRSPTGQPMSNMALLACLGRLGARDRTTVHGLCRSTFSTWANETAAARPDVIEACLAHAEGNRVRAAYNRAQFTEERRALMQAWSDYLAQPAAQVVAIRAA